VSGRGIRTRPIVFRGVSSPSFCSVVKAVGCDYVPNYRCVTDWTVATSK